MGSLIQPELTLDCSLSSKNWVPKSAGEFLLEVSMLHSASEKILKLDDFVNRLQDEMRKIDAFKRELPLCMILLNDAIAMMKKELNQCKSSAEPIIEEFIPLKKKRTDEKDEKLEEKDVTNSREKMNWMSSVQLWNSDNNQHHHPNAENLNYEFPIPKRDNNKKRKEEVINPPMMDDLFPSGKNRKLEEAFDPLKGCNVFPVMNVERNELSGVTELSLRTPEIKNSKEEIYTNGFSSKPSSSRSGSSSPPNGQSNVKDQTNRKQRRCWSPELHRRFVSALQRLGGPQAATPKQIRELMQVDGLTNDEVKSHLQKYRLHARKIHQSTNPSTIELGGLWVPEEHCGESSKPSNSQSGSPQGPLHLNGTCRVTSITGPDSLEEEEEDEKTESHSWKSQNHLSMSVDV
ncbi:two-component response regulator arr18 [Phtheirospermum japonicum]|uniref:Two-component response regulator arr18 n=1 Tax=Phtheirospermum japonicum TaxID=374723 RepID=A0A830BLD8_9LAMI|nr:two-component response regulator arr18 [Phtheirospermum japonicum]